MTRRVLIVGLGLIGGSAGIALSRRGWRVEYFDPHVPLEAALQAGAAHGRVTAIGGEGVILLATPLDVAVEQLRSIAAAGVVTSVCSVMRPLREAARTHFVAGHPLAGSHERGLEAARGDLFEGKPWFVDGDDERVDELIRDCGAVRERVEAAEHDAAVALTSHLPQVLSTALAAYLHDRPDLLRFAGSGLQTFLRLAGSDAGVWLPVLEANRDHLAPQLEATVELARALTTDDFEKAQRVWRALAAK